jgi:1,4-alpha-glucan branching enzyme
MWALPGKQLLFMGGEFGQKREWAHEESLEWHVLQYPLHAGVQNWLRDLNRLYRSLPALHARDFSPEGFEWIDCNDGETSVLSFLRRGPKPRDQVLVVCNFTPVPRTNYRVGVPTGGRWVERLNSDASLYGGSGSGNLGGVAAVPAGAHGRFHSLTLHLPPLSALYFTPEADA